MSVSAKDVMALRQRTGMGMMECKAALAEAAGNTDAAVEILRKAAKGKMDDRTDRTAAQGTLAIAADKSGIVLIELNTETDFVARNDSFIEAAEKIALLALASPGGAIQSNAAMQKIVDDVRLTTRENARVARGQILKTEAGQKTGSYLHHNRQVGAVILANGEIDDETLTGLCQHISAHHPIPQAVDEAGLDQAEIAKARQGFIDEAKASGKPAEIAEKMSTGRMRKWVDERTLLGQSYVKDMTGKTTVRDLLPKGTSIKTFVRYEVGTH